MQPCRNDTAKKAGADIACLPETALLGWVNPEAHKRACAVPGADSDRLCKLAKDFGIYLCVGLAEKDGGKLYDSALLIGNAGQILLKHRKINLLSELMTGLEAFFIRNVLYLYTRIDDFKFHRIQFFINQVHGLTAPAIGAKGGPDFVLWPQALHIGQKVTHSGEEPVVDSR